LARLLLFITYIIVYNIKRDGSTTPCDTVALYILSSFFNEARGRECGKVSR